MSREEKAFGAFSGGFNVLVFVLVNALILGVNAPAEWIVNGVLWASGSFAWALWNVYQEVKSDA